MIDVEKLWQQACDESTSTVQPQEVFAGLVLERAAYICEAEKRLGIDDERAYYGSLMADAIRKVARKVCNG